jgi:hypothetical protein
MQPNEIKPGYRTTEFWLSAAAAAVGLLMASGLLVEGSALAQSVGLIATALSAMGYSAARGKAKTAAAPADEKTPVRKDMLS